MNIDLTVDGTTVRVPDDGSSLLDTLREHLGIRSVKDGCSPQGQCGCCTVLVDGQPRVACVTPTRRVAGRSITTFDGLDTESPDLRQCWSEAFTATGASQCGFCTPGIIVRLEGLRRRGTPADDHTAVERALAAHLCRCTGWRTILDAWDIAAEGQGSPMSPVTMGARDLTAAARRAAIEGHTTQEVGAQVAAGRAGFADDLAPSDALVAIPTQEGEGWVVAETRHEARIAAGRVQGRRTTEPARPALELPDGQWSRTLRTSWVEPAYLELDASWCEPGGEPATPLANGGAFGAKTTSEVGAVARRLADEHGRAVRVLLTREDVVRRGPKRPPVAGGVRSDGTGVLHVARTPGIAEAIAAVAPELEVREIDLQGPPTSAAIRGAGWMEALILCASVQPSGPVRLPDGAEAEAIVGDDGAISVQVRCGQVLDETVLRSYCIGAVHMAASWVTSESLTLDDQGVPLDLTIRSFGILRAGDTPPVHVEILADEGEPSCGSDAVFAATALAVWRHHDHHPVWPTGRPIR